MVVVGAEPSELGDFKRWVAQQMGVPESQCELLPLSGDAGFRRYFRVAQVSDQLAVFAPPSTENNKAFVCLAAAMANWGIACPRVIAYQEGTGYLLVDDLGETLMFDQLSAVSVDGWYESAMALMVNLQQRQVSSLSWNGFTYQLPHYDDTMLRREMALFPQWFVQQLLGLGVSTGEQTLIESAFSKLVGSAQEQPQVLVHRDFHCRNVMVKSDGELALIDFQDAVIGPITYDPVSLFKDCYVRWPVDAVTRWQQTFRARAIEAGILAEDVSESQWQRWFDWMGLQRHLKVLGIFSRLYLRDGKARYLNDLPLVLRYVMEVTARYPEFEALNHWLSSSVIPVCAAQPWYTDWQTAGERS